MALMMANVGIPSGIPQDQNGAGLMPVSGKRYSTAQNGKFKTPVGHQVMI
jgi:hypothetical protein